MDDDQRPHLYLLPEGPRDEGPRLYVVPDARGEVWPPPHEGDLLLERKNVRRAIRAVLMLLDILLGAVVILALIVVWWLAMAACAC